MLNKQQKSIFIGLMVFVLVTGIPVAFSSTLGDDWKSIKNSLSDGEKSIVVTESLSHVNNAHLIYINSFKNAALEVDPQSDTIIENAIDDIVTNHNNGDIEMASLNRQVIDKTIYKIAYMKMQLSVEQDNVEDFLSWYTVLDKKFKVSEKNYESNIWVSQIQSDPLSLSSNGDAILKEMLTIFKLKTIEELEEAIAAASENNISEAKEKVIEGFHYARTLSPAIDAKLGTTSGYEGLIHEMEEAMEIVNSDISSIKMKPQLEHVLDEVELLISEYDDKDTSNLGLALSGIRDRLNLVDAEYVYAVNGGQIIDQGEYDETIVFLSKAIILFETHNNSFNEISNTDTKNLKANLNQIKSIVDSKGNPSEISIIVAKSQNNIAQLIELHGGAEEITSLEYVAKIKDLLFDVKDHYAQGHSDMALQFATTAYLDNYEFIESDIAYHDVELMEKIEHAMRVELRDMIKTGVSSEDVNAHVDMIIQDLTIAEKVIPEFGTITVMILAVAIISIIAISAKSRLSIMPRY